MKTLIRFFKNVKKIYKQLLRFLKFVKIKNYRDFNFDIIYYII